MKKILLLVLSLFLALPVYGADTKGSALTDGSGSIAGTDYVLGYTTTGPASRRYTVNSVLSLVTPTTLGLVIGTDVQAFNTNLTAINQALTNTSNPAFSTLNLTGAGLTVGTGSTTSGLLQIKNSTNNNIFTLQPGATGAALSWTLPTAAPAGNGYLVTASTAGVLSYTDPSTLGAGASVSDVAYDATTWDAVTTAAPSKNAVRDYLESKMPSGADGSYGIILTNNTAITPTAATDEIYFEANVLKTNQNGVESSVAIGPTGTQINFSGTLTNGSYCTFATGGTISCNSTPAGGVASTDIDTSAELVTLVTDETGSASGTPLLVFNQAPTIVTPILTSPQMVITTSGLTQDNVYYRTSGSAWATADANGSSTYPARCYAISTTQCLIGGSVTRTTHGFTVGADLYLSETAGAVTTTAPTTSASVVQKIGWVLDANTLIVGIAPDYGTVQ